jgi:hypothetical protein
MAAAGNNVEAYRPAIPAAAKGAVQLKRRRVTSIDATHTRHEDGM